MLKVSVLKVSALKVSVRRRVWNALFIAGACTVAVALNAKATRAQTVFEVSTESSLTLLPLTAARVETTHHALPLDEVNTQINEQIAIAREQPTEAEGLSFDQIPLINELLDEEGNFDMGIELPFSVSVTDVMGSYGMVLSADFAPSFSQASNALDADEIAPIDR
ncbi:MAG: hypothetical protein AAFZ17_02410 [Cyanobacteria bacterium J06650_10]